MHLFPLTRARRLQVAQAFSHVPTVDISVACVVEDQMGRVFVDSTESPQYFMVEQDKFFCYFSGDWTTPAGREFLGATPRGRILMAGTPGWGTVLEEMFGENLVPITRHRYSADSLSAERLKSMAAANPNTPHIQRIDSRIAAMGVPNLEIGAFESPEDFEERGIGYCMMHGDEVIGIAYSSLVCSHSIEVSIIVSPDHYRRGIATALSCQLLLACLARGISPHWDAANSESCALAEKIGYTKLGDYAAYFLKPLD